MKRVLGKSVIVEEKEQKKTFLSDEKNKYKEVLKWFKAKKGVMYFNDSISGYDMTTMVVEDIIASDSSFWNCFDKLKEKLREKKKAELEKKRSKRR